MCFHCSPGKAWFHICATVWRCTSGSAYPPRRCYLVCTCTCSVEQSSSPPPSQRHTAVCLGDPVKHNTILVYSGVPFNAFTMMWRYNRHELTCMHPRCLLAVAQCASTASSDLKRWMPSMSSPAGPLNSAMMESIAEAVSCNKITIKVLLLKVHAYVTDAN